MPERLLVLLVHRRHDDHAGLLGEVLHPLGRRAVGDQLGVAVVAGVLDLAEVRPVEQLLEQDELGTLLGGLVGSLLVLLDHRFLVAGPAGLDERAADGSGHVGVTSLGWVVVEGSEGTSLLGSFANRRGPWSGGHASGSYLPAIAPETRPDPDHCALLEPRLSTDWSVGAAMIRAEPPS